MNDCYNKYELCNIMQLSVFIYASNNITLIPTNNYQINFKTLQNYQTDVTCLIAFIFLYVQHFECIPLILNMESDLLYVINQCSILWSSEREKEVIDILFNQDKKTNKTRQDYYIKDKYSSYLGRNYKSIGQKGYKNNGNKRISSFSSKRYSRFHWAQR